MPVAAILSVDDPSNSHEPSFSCLRASQASPRATAASDSLLPPPALSSLSLVEPDAALHARGVKAPPPPPTPAATLPVSSVRVGVEPGPLGR